MLTPITVSNMHKALVTELKGLSSRFKTTANRRIASIKPSDWAQKYRKIANFRTKELLSYSFDDFPFQKGIINDETQEIIIMKCAQIGISECALNLVFYYMDVKNWSALYLMPSKDDASDFTASKFDPALESSPHLSRVFTEVSNLGHKRAGNSSLYVRGTRSKTKAISISVNLLIIDEFDFCVTENAKLAEERVKGQDVANRKMVKLSTPSLPGVGIDFELRNSADIIKEWTVKHGCGHYFIFSIEHYNDYGDYMCPGCKKVVTEAEREYILREGEWNNRGKEVNCVGYMMNRFVSPVWTLARIYEDWQKAQQSEMLLQLFYNNYLGLPFIANSAKLDRDTILACVGQYDMFSYCSNNTTMGVDVGKQIHFKISEWEDIPREFDGGYTTGKKKTVKVGVCDFEAIPLLCSDFNVRICVIDLNPETRKVEELQEKMKATDTQVFAATYPNMDDAIILRYDEEKRRVKIHRTRMMDRVFSRFVKQNIQLPRDITEEYIQHLMAPAKLYEEDKNGNVKARYVEGSKADHLAHAELYDDTAGILLGCVFLDYSEVIRTIR